MLFLTIFVLILIMVMAWVQYRDILCPAVLHNFFWIASLLGIATLDDIRMPKIQVYIFLIIGALLFQFGFYISLRSTIKITRNPDYFNIIVYNHRVKGLINGILIAAIPVVVQYYLFMRSSDMSLYEVFKSASDELQLPGLFDYYRKVVQFITLAFLTIYWKMDISNRKGLKTHIIILFIISVLCVISVPTRNRILWFLLPLFFVYTITHSIPNKTIIVIGLISVGVFLGVFYIISLNKYWYLYDDGVNPLSVVLDELKVYLSGSVIAFGNNIKENSSVYHGQNSFRFFYAISDKVFKTTLALKLTNNFVNIGNNVTTNVFTFYDFYLRDFGLFYAGVAQFIVSCIHGTNYKKCRNNKLINIYYCSLLSYPLVMQFFQDQYLSLLSTWIQIIIVGVVIFKLDFFFRIDPVYIDK